MIRRRSRSGYLQKTRFLLLTLSGAFFPSTTPFILNKSSFLSTSSFITNPSVRLLSISKIEHSSIYPLRSVLGVTSLRMMTTATDKSNENTPNVELTTEKTTSDIVLDRSLFDQNIRLIAINIPAKLCTVYMKEFKDYLLKRPRMKRIYDIEKDGVKDEERRLLILNEDLGDNLLLPTLPQNLIDFNIKNDGIPEIFMLKVSYENIPVDEVLRKVLPEEIIEIPSSFEQVGHIAHLNLRDEVLKYKHLIGQVILDKNSNIRTVVNKVGTIETEFRTFPMEVIAGDADFVVTLRESNAKFNFNFKDVYWNSRLQMEHSRLIDFITTSSLPPPLPLSVPLLSDKERQEVEEGGGGGGVESNGNIVEGEGEVIATNKNKKNNKNNNNNNNKDEKMKSIESSKIDVIVADMMAGVGPFAVPLAINRITVYANDLNPESFKYLNKNMKINHCEKYLSTHNQCARDFVLSLVEEGKVFNEAIMNLPQSATDFLDVFIGLSNRKDRNGKSVFTSDNLPRIHVYAFSTAEDPILDIVQRSARTMQCTEESMQYETTVLTPSASNREIKNCGGKKVPSPSLSSALCWGHIVRDVSPKKMMVCLTFRLPLVVATASPLHFTPYVSSNNSNNSSSSSKDSNSNSNSLENKNEKKRNADGEPKV